MPRTWRRLTETLEATTDSTVEMTFDELSALVEVPVSEMKQRSWWKDARDDPQTKAWRDAGYQVEDVDVDAGRVTFTQL